MAHRINDDCNGCSACARQCPTEAIDGVFKQSYQIDGALCIDCGVCGMICAREAVEDGAGALAVRLRRAERPRPLFDRDLCNGCGLCVVICPEDCLGVIGDPYRGISYLANPLRCVSCGECAAICIKRAVTMEPVALKSLDPEAEIIEITRSIEESEGS